MNKRNYVMLNGIDSRMIEGLLVSELPAITKPPMRTTTEEIDGKAGDIITKLGYSAYDRQMTIGLHGDYDLDEVIKYFASDGTAIFSNEPDKVYDYQILKEINFERLIRYKTATVTFHVQPFKKSAIDGDGIDKSLNRFSIPNFSQTKNGVSVSVTDGVITASGTATKPTEFYLPVTGLESLERGSFELDVSLSGDANNGLMRICDNAPLNSMSMGGTYLPIKDTMYTVTVNRDSGFNTLWLYLKGTVGFTMSLGVLVNSIDVFNVGNYYSMPVYTINGTGTATLSVNGGDAFIIVMPASGQLTLDVANLEAYNGSVAYNRNVSGDYKNLQLSSGNNRVAWTGNVTKIHVDNYSLWI